MKVKNNTKANFQFNIRMNPGEVHESENQFGNIVRIPAKPEIKLIHIPGGATVIIDEDTYAALMAAKTTVYGYQDVVEEVEEADILMGKNKLKIKSRIQNGEAREISLFEQAVNRNDLIIIHEKPVVEPSTEEMANFITSKGLTLADGMSSVQIKELYQKLK